jgi:hypothetical protein
MKIMKSSVAYAMNLCARFTQALGWRSKALDFTQQTTEAEKALAHGLWAAYNINLPDTPKRVAMAVNHILTEKGYYIGTYKKP